MATVTMTPEAQADRHLESGEVASYLDRVLAPAEQARVEAHLADCAVGEPLPA